MAYSFYLLLRNWALDLWHSLSPRRIGVNMNLITVLNRLGNQINDSYPAINEGGCCVYAAAIGAELRKRKINVRIIVGAYDDKIDIDAVRPQLSNTNKKEEWNSVDVWFNHVGVEFEYNGKVYHYDSDGVHRASKKLGRFYVYKGRLSVAEARALAAEPEGWNDCFERKQIPKLKRHIKTYLAANFPQ